jgi:hypothetical protein
MQRLNSRSRIIYTAVGAFLGWFAVIAQLYLILENRAQSIHYAIAQFLSYFTILTNIIVAFIFTVLIIKNQSVLKTFVSRSNTLTATAVYIFVVGLIYNFVLRQLWVPEGLQRLVDELLHLIMPILYLIYWFLFVPKKDLQWKDAVIWLVYPFIYLIFILIHGELTNFYPYPFVNVTSLGYSEVLYNSGVIMTFFIFISLLFIGIGRISKKE